MLSKTLYALSALPLAVAQETVYGVYIFSRHGDRTPKILPPANLTQLGYQEVYQRGQYYRSRYIASEASLKIAGINTDIVKLSQIAVSAPQDNVLQSSANGFLQGLYPPYETNQTLRNGTTIDAPMGGYQIIPINLASSGSGSEDNGWLQDATGCGNAVKSSNNYFLSAQYQSLLSSTSDFYKRLTPVINSTFSAANINFKNAYTIFDYINVAEIHNQTIPSSNLLDNSTLFQLRTLADHHEFGLAYNASDNTRAIAGMQLAAEIVDYLNGTITSGGKQKLGIQFGAYGTFLSFFGLSNLTAASEDFYGVNDYASTMVFELFANGTSSTMPSADELFVRFLFHNGTSATSVDPTPFPLFGGSDLVIPWNTFAEKMGQFSVGTTEDWCKVCGNTTGTCAAYATEVNGSSSTASGTGGSSGGISKAVAGVIGAMVTLGVILGLEALILAVGGLRVVSKKKLQASPPTSVAQAKA
ncbi:uncharacterized protein PV09_00120 [Verruconis gallopava]|uniref:Acid phosphatase n=1 Tax=Verruconis gallopava TaxID=253628 RepID=A0A0D2ARP0_9PEZI|nr:uncharacterized protein PV09_00120 [Verruconis gallopava]KIW09190.1 hypothetical protein PV09_00120 [Verruconis gallopava]